MFLRTETGSAAVLVAATVAALVWINVSTSSYASVWDARLTVRLAGAAAGAGVSAALPVHGFMPNAAVTVLASAVATLVFLGVTLLADGGDLRAGAVRLLSRFRAPRSPAGALSHPAVLRHREV